MMLREESTCKGARRDACQSRIVRDQERKRIEPSHVGVEDWRLRIITDGAKVQQPGELVESRQEVSFWSFGR